MGTKDNDKRNDTERLILNINKLEKDVAELKTKLAETKAKDAMLKQKLCLRTIQVLIPHCDSIGRSVYICPNCYITNKIEMVDQIIIDIKDDQLITLIECNGCEYSNRLLSNTSNFDFAANSLDSFYVGMEVWTDPQYRGGGKNETV